MRRFLVMAAALALHGSEHSSLAADRPTALPGQAHRSEAVAVNGMVCASHPLAAQIGLDV